MPSGTSAGLATGNILMDAGTNMFNAGMQDHQNKKQREFSREMYERTRADNIDFWNMQNAYNSPEAQMQRFQAAGLNPNLIYGQGNSGNAGSIPTPDVQPVNYKAPQFERLDLLQPLLAIADLNIKKEQANNLQAQNTVIAQEAMYKAALVNKLGIDTKRSQFAFDLDSELRQTSADYRRQQLRALETMTDLGIKRDVREGLSNEAYLKQAAEGILNSRQQRAQSRAEVDRINSSRKNLDVDTRLKELDESLRKNGINPTDPTWMRILGRATTDLLEQGPSTSLDALWKWFTQ